LGTGDHAVLPCGKLGDLAFAACGPADNTTIAFIVTVAVEFATHVVVKSTDAFCAPLRVALSREIAGAAERQPTNGN
jgi:hypothetical protein